MRMRVAFAVAGLAFGALFSSAAAQATTYDLAADFGTLNDPGSPWSITYSGGNLPEVGAVGINGNHLEPAVTGAYYGTGTNLNTDNPFAFVAGANGVDAGLTNEDFVIGDVVIHTPNDGSALTISWQAPSAGTIDNFIFNVWYAHSSVTRSNDVAFTGPGGPFSWVTSTALNSTKSGAGSLTGSGIPITAGELLTLTFTKTALQSFGSLTGLNLSFDFNAAATPTVPIPATLPLFAAGLAGFGWMARQRRKRAA